MKSAKCRPGPSLYPRRFVPILSDTLSSAALPPLPPPFLAAGEPASVTSQPSTGSLNLWEQTTAVPENHRLRRFFAFLLRPLLRHRAISAPATESPFPPVRGMLQSNHVVWVSSNSALGVFLQPLDVQSLLPNW